MSVDLHIGDCRDVLRTLPENSADCIIADPPYGETSLEWDRWPTGWVAETLRVLKPSGSMWVFGSLRMFFGHLAEFDGWRLVQEIVWEKHNGSNMCADRFRRVHELALHFIPARSRWADVYRCPVYSNDATARRVRRKQRPQHWGDIGGHYFESEEGGPRLMRSVIYARSEHGRAIHPTQKPVGLVGTLIEYSTPPGGMVLDPFLGSGTTAIASIRHGCNCIGIEARPSYAEAARHRIATDSPLFAEAEA